MRDAEPTTVYVLGAAGQLGSALRARLAAARLQARVKWLTSADVDIADGSSVDAALRGLAGGDVVLNCAAYTDVDGAESDRAGAFLVNAEGPANLARATAPAGAWLIHISTDYVFSDAAAGATATGGTRHPFEPDDSTSVTPATVYGASKLAGERAALAADPRTTVVRTAWVYTGTEASKDFVGTMRRLERTRESVSVVDDQLGSPTYALDLAAGLWELAAAGP
ncbi:sugar nucleotide-binding protein, partial [Gordonia sp. NPDC003585]